MPNQTGYENEGLSGGLQRVTYASMQQARETMAGAKLGAQTLMASSVLGTQQMIADMGRLMPSSPLPNMHPFMAVRHGMYAHEMSLSGSVGAMVGKNIPDTTSLYEYAELAARDFGQRTSNAALAAAMHGSVALGAVAMTPGGLSVIKDVAVAGAKAVAGAGGVISMAKTGITTAARGGAAAFGKVAGMLPKGTIPGILAYGLADLTVGKVLEDVADRQDITNFLEASSFRYMQGRGADIDERMGAGFNRAARGRIAEAIKDIDLNDPRYNMNDLKGILEKGTELGMFTGTRDAEDFSQKFKDLTSSLKQVTKIMHQSLNEGMETLKSLKEMGISTPTGVSTAIQHADVLGTATGKTAAEMLSIGRQGAEMVRGTGVNLSTGSDMMQQTFSLMSSAATGGTLDAEHVRQAGGVGALTQKMMARHMQNLNTPFGKGALLSVIGEGGRLDPSRLNQLTSGEMSMGNVYRQASQNVSTVQGYVQSVINREKNLNDLGEQYGGMGIPVTSLSLEMAQAREASRFTKMGVRDTLKFLAMQRGESEAEIEARLKMAEDYQAYDDKQQAAIEFQYRKTRGESLREMTNVGKILGDKLDRLMSPVSTYVGRKVDSASEAMSDLWRGTTDKILETISGIDTVKAYKIGDRDLADLFIGGDLSTDVDPNRRIQETLNYSDADLLRFKEKSEAYKKLDKEFIQKSEKTDMFAAMQKGLQGFSQAMFGKAFERLSTDEKKFLESKAREYSTDLADAFKTKRLESQKKMRDDLAIRLGKSKEDTEVREEELKDARSDVEGMMWPFSDGGDLVEEVYDNADKDPQSARNLDDIITSTVDEDRLKKRLEEEQRKPPEERNEDLVSKLTEKIETAQEVKNKARMELGKKIKDPEKMLSLEKILGRTLETGQAGRLKDIAFKIKDSRRLVDMARKGDMSVQLQAALKDKFSLLKRTTESKLIGKGAGEMRESVSRLLDDIAQGKELDTDELEQLGEIAKESRSSELASIADTAMRIKGAEKKGLLSDTDKLEKFMSERNMIPKELLDDPKRKTELLNSFFEGNKIQAEKLIQWEVLSKKVDREGGTRFSGGRTNERMLESEAVAMQGIVEVQAKTLALVTKLQELALQLEDRTRKRGK
jgi:hypothetical protein